MNEILQTQFIGNIEGLKSRINVRERLTPEFYQKEVDEIFRKVWLPVASLTDLPDPHCYVTADVPPLNASFIVARGADGEIRAFYNVCRHRGAAVIRPDHPKGCRKAFSCGFHGWTYSTDGRLIGVTDSTQFEDIDPAMLGLIEVNADTWEDYVFINVDPSPRMSLKQWMGSFHDEYRGFFDNRERISDYRITVDGNWNICINAFSEGYHNLYVHRKTVPDYQGGASNPLRHRTYVEVNSHHGRYAANGNPNRKVTPVEQIAYGTGRLMYPAFPRYTPETLPLPPGINVTRDENWSFDVVEIFPFMIILIGAHWHANLRFLPVDENRTDIRLEQFGYKAETIGDHLAHAYFRTRMREVFREDISFMEQTTGALKSGALREIILSKQEMLLQKHYAVADSLVSGSNA
jgi:glycine betaine catabolism A